jgi:hypothetical protein
MRRTWIGAGVVLASVLAACGAGRVIFNVDVYSFMTGSAKDTVSYPAVPPLTSSFTVSNPPQKINLVPGLGQSGIDTVRVSGAANVINQAGGPGTLRFQVYLAADSAGTYGAGKDSMFSPAPTATITAGASTQTMIFAAPNLSPSGDSLFTNSSVWIRMEATVSNSGATFMSGKAVLTGLDLRVVVTDQLF